MLILSISSQLKPLTLHLGLCRCAMGHFWHQRKTPPLDQANAAAFWTCILWDMKSHEIWLQVHRPLVISNFLISNHSHTSHHPASFSYKYPYNLSLERHIWGLFSHLHLTGTSHFSDWYTAKQAKWAWFSNRTREHCVFYAKSGGKSR